MRQDRRSHRFFLLILCCSAALALATPINAAPFLAQLESPGVRAGDPVTIHLVSLNPASGGARQIFPTTFKGTLVAGPAREDLVFSTSENLPADGLSIDANSFARITYTAIIPAGFFGPAHIEIAIDGSPSFAISITPKSGATTGDTVPVAKRFSIRTAKDQGTTETSFFRRHMFPYEPVYFIAGPDSPNAKFQISFKYRLVNTELGGNGEPGGWLYRNAPWSRGLHLAYTQLSLWDLGGDSAPFLDSNYMPELFYELPNMIDPETGWLERIGAQAGFQHKSNGMAGTDSRSQNRAYLRMPFVLGNEDDFYVLFQPQGWFYVGDLSDNPDIAYYQGYADLKLKAGWADGLQVASVFSAGKEFNKGSVQVDLTYPMHNLLSRSFSIYLQAQYFHGYGETLLYYNQQTEMWRIGIGLFR